MNGCRQEFNLVFPFRAVVQYVPIKFMMTLYNITTKNEDPL